jgi:predicted ATPase/DNA-binding SARP family transcriptional activator/Tfp pilus assembly protein PilF
MVWRITLFGGMACIRGDCRLTRFRTQKTALLLAYVAYHCHRTHARGELVELFWPEHTPEAGRDNLSVALSSLRRQLEPPGVPCGAVIVADRHSVQLNPAACVTDVVEFEAAIKAAARAATRDERLGRLIEAIHLYGGELLPGHLDDWVLRERQHLAEEHLGALRRLASVLEQAGDLEGALEYARRAVRADPLSEEGHYDLMRLYAAAGQPSAALGQYERLEQLLRRELDETPSAGTRALAEELRCNPRTVAVARRVPGTTVASPMASPPEAVAPARLSPPAPALRLPLQFTRFFGREEEIARVSEALSCSETRLLTLTGPGGSGKTRLAIAVAGRLQEALGERMAFVSLADLTDARQIPDAMVGALGAPRSAGLDPLEQVIALLSQQPWLLVLDNLEHLLVEGALLVKSLLERVATLTCLITSRQRLNLAGEYEFAVLPLPTPRKSDTPERLLEYASVRLFVDRAQAARPDFQVTVGNAGAVATLCDRLEGIPLALELAGARASVLSPAQMLTRLDQRFDVLVSRQRGGSSRHRTLRSAIDWSYTLLSPELQRFFARLGVFRGGWTLEAAEMICEEGVPAAADRGEAARAGPVLDSLSHLQECSLVIAETSGTRDEIRFRMLDTLREYAHQQLTPEERAFHACRHATYYLALAEQAEPEACRSVQETRFDRLEQEQDNLRAALQWAVDAGAGTQAGSPSGGQAAAAVGLRLGAALWRFWHTRGDMAEGREWLAGLLALPGAAAWTATRAHALQGMAKLALDQGDPKAAQAFYAESLAIARELGDKREIAHSLNSLGDLAISRGDLRDARALYAESLALHQELKDQRGIAITLGNLGDLALRQGDLPDARTLVEESLLSWREQNAPWGIAHSLSLLGGIARDQGDHQAARSLVEESLAIQRELGNKKGIARALNHMGDLALDQGDDQAAWAFYRESLAISQAAGYRWGISWSLKCLGNVALQQGDSGAAKALYEESLALARELGGARGIAGTLLGLGRVALHRGETTAARAFFAEGLATQREPGSKPQVVEGLEGLAAVAVAHGQAERAARLFGAAAGWWEGVPVPREQTEKEAHLAALRVVLGDAAFAAAWEAGRALTWEQALALALAEG